MEIIVHKPHGMNFDLDVIPYIRVSFQKSMNKFWYVSIGWLYGELLSERVSIPRKSNRTHIHPSTMFLNNKAQKGEEG